MVREVLPNEEITVWGRMFQGEEEERSEGWNWKNDKRSLCGWSRDRERVEEKGTCGWLGPGSEGLRGLWLFFGARRNALEGFKQRSEKMELGL